MRKRMPELEAADYILWMTYMIRDQCEKYNMNKEVVIQDFIDTINRNLEEPEFEGAE